MSKYLNEQPIKLAYLFGSQATGHTTPLSDVDVGVIFEDEVPEDEKFDLRMRLMIDLSTIAKRRSSVEVVPLDRTPDPFRYEATGGIELVNQDENFVRNFRYQAMRDYLTNLHYRQLHTQIYLDRVAEKGLS